MSSEITLYANRVALPLIEIFETINSISITVTMVFENTIIFKLHLHSIWSFQRPAKPLFMGFSAIFQATQTRQF